MQFLDEILAIIKSVKGNLEFLSTGFPRLDQDLDGGFMRKELIILGGQTGIGKSYVSGQIFLTIAKQGYKCAYFSLEIANTMVVSRLIGSLANLKPTRVYAGLLTPDEFTTKIKSEASLESYADFMNFYDDLYELEAIKKEIKTNKYEFVVIDFVQNVVAKGQDEYTRLSYVALELQKFAKEQNCCILILSQVSNSMAREGAKATVPEYKGSGSIATVCDLGFFITKGDQMENTDMNLLHLRKNRRGVSGLTYQLVFQKPGGWITAL